MNTMAASSGIGVRQIWFAQMIQSALVATVTDAYADFGTLGGFVGYVPLGYQGRPAAERPGRNDARARRHPQSHRRDYLYRSALLFHCFVSYYSEINDSAFRR